MKTIYKKYSSLYRAVDNAKCDNWDERHAIKTRAEEFASSLPLEVRRKFSRAYNQRYIYVVPINKKYQILKEIVDGRKFYESLGWEFD